MRFCSAPVDLSASGQNATSPQVALNNRGEVVVVRSACKLLYGSLRILEAIQVIKQTIASFSYLPLNSRISRLNLRMFSLVSSPVVCLTA